MHRFFAGNSLRNYTYIIHRSATGEGVVLDPWDGEEVLAEARTLGTKLVGVYNTHQHHDHVRGNAVLSEHGVPVWTSWSADWSDWQEWASPGHTVEHRVLFHPAGPWLFSGDTVFQAGVGNCKHGGDPATLHHTLQGWLARLPDHTVVLPGHDYLRRNLEFAAHVGAVPAVSERLTALPAGPTEELPPLSWGEEKVLNPFLRAISLARDVGDGEMAFIKLRRLRDDW